MAEMAQQGAIQLSRKLPANFSAHIIGFRNIYRNHAITMTGGDIVFINFRIGAFVFYKFKGKTRNTVMFRNDGQSQ